MIGGESRQDSAGFNRLSLTEEQSQHIVHHLQAFVLRGVQQFQVLFDGGCFGRPLRQLIVRHPKSGCGVHVVDVFVVQKRARLADQRVDDVPEVDRFLVTAELARHTFLAGVAIPQLQVILMDADFHPQANVLAADGVRIVFDSHDAVGLDLDSHRRHDVETLAR